MFWICSISIGFVRSNACTSFSFGIARTNRRIGVILSDRRHSAPAEWSPLWSTSCIHLAITALRAMPGIVGHLVCYQPACLAHRSRANNERTVSPGLAEIAQICRSRSEQRLNRNCQIIRLTNKRWRKVTHQSVGFVNSFANAPITNGNIDSKP